MLERLAARHLTAREVFAASVRKNARTHSPLLSIRRDSDIGHYHLMTEMNPYYVARAEPDRGLPDIDDDGSALDA